jgi:hypothetical protein
VHCDQSNADLIGLSKIGRQFIVPVISGRYADFESFPLPFPEDSVGRENFFRTIHNLGTGSHQGSVKLILKPNPKIDLPDDLGTIKYFIYESVDIASLHAAFINKLPSADDLRQNKPTSETFADAWRILEKDTRQNLDGRHAFKLFLLGLIRVKVDSAAGMKLGKPSLASNGKRQITLWAFTEYGVVDPALVLSSLDISTEDARNFFSPPPNGAIESTFQWTSESGDVQDRLFENLSLDKTDFIENKSKSFIYPYTVLRLLKKNLPLDKNTWREVGDGQKGLFIEKLARRVGTAELFRFFDWNDRFNVFQLEAVAEFFCKGTQAGPGPNHVDIDLNVNFLEKSSLGWTSTNPRRSQVYLVQIDRMSDLGGPRTGLRLSATGYPAPRAFDEYEGCMFVVSGGEIKGIFHGFSSFTGKVNEDVDGEPASSIEGNRRYLFRSRRSPLNKAHNYAFIVAPDQNLSMNTGLPAWFFWGRRLPEPTLEPGIKDPNGKGFIVLHRGNNVIKNFAPTDNDWNGSDGCQVSPIATYYSFRKTLCDIWVNDEIQDVWVSLVGNTQPASSELIYKNSKDHLDLENKLAKELRENKSRLDGHTEFSIVDGPIELDLLPGFVEYLKNARTLIQENDGIILSEHWDGKVVGTYFLVRPFERTLNTPQGERRLIMRPLEV